MSTDKVLGDPNCRECGGKGWYYVYNVYDPKAKDKVMCEYCTAPETKDGDM